MLPIGVPQEFFAGRMFAQQAPAYEAAAKQAGDKVHAYVLEKAGHFVFIDPASEPWRQVVRGTQALLDLSN